MITQKYANFHMFSDVEPYEIVKVISDKTIEVRGMTCTRNFKPEWIPGGFAGVCTNQQDQEWLIESNPTNNTLRLRKRKDGNFYKGSMKFILSNTPSKYYDFNF